MFGYVKTDNPNMIVKDTVLYKAMYCGLCKGIGKSCNQRGRLSLNYDLTFLSLFAHNVLDKDVKIEKQRCMIHWLRSRPIAVPDDLTLRIARLNVILAYYKCHDDVIDSKKGRIKKSFFKSAYKKAKKVEPEFDKAVFEMYNALREFENKNTDSIDMISDPFGVMMQQIIKELLGDKATEDVLQLAYYLGKWIYLIDAVDDFEKDKKRNNFNVFVVNFPNINSKQELMNEQGQFVKDVFGETLFLLKQSAQNIKYNFNHDLIDNIIYRGLDKETHRITEGCNR